MIAQLNLSFVHIFFFFADNLDDIISTEVLT